MLRRLLLNLLLVLGSVLFFLVAAEVVCRIFFPDTRIRYVTDQETLAVLEPNQEGFIYLSDGSRAPKVRINELGIRGGGLNDVSGRRVLFLGDSFTFGSGVEEEQTFVALVDHALGDQVSVVNGGHPGYGIYQIEILFNRLYPVVRPDTVVLVVWESLILRQRYPKQGHEDFIRRMEKLNRLKSISVFATHVYRMYEQVSLSFGADDLVVALHETKEPQFSDEVLFERAMRLDRERILRIRDTVRSHGGEFAIVFWPRAGYVEGGVETGMSAWLASRFEEFGREYAIPVYSVQHTLAAHPPEELNIPNDGHPTPFAHCLVASSMRGMFEYFGYPWQRPIRCAVQSSSR